MVLHQQITYSVVRGFRPLLLDLYIPDDVPRPPVVVWIHGGGFESGDRRWLHRTFPRDAVFTGLVDAGIACASIDYRLSGEACWPAQSADAAAAINYLRDRAADYDIDTDRLATWGDSAGGLLALHAAFTHPRVTVAAAWYPITDIAAMEAELGELPYSPWLGGWPSSMPKQVSDASPITHVTAESPPCLLIHGERDTVVPASQSRRLRDRLEVAGVETRYREIVEAGHGFEGYSDVAGLVKETIDYLGAKLGATKNRR